MLRSPSVILPVIVSCWINRLWCLRHAGRFSLFLCEQKGKHRPYSGVGFVSKLSLKFCDVEAFDEVLHETTVCRQICGEPSDGDGIGTARTLSRSYNSRHSEDFGLERFRCRYLDRQALFDLPHPECDGFDLESPSELKQATAASAFPRTSLCRILGQCG
jgi:hypothetical protein